MVNVVFFGFGSSFIVYEKMISKSDWINNTFCISQTSTFYDETIKVFSKKNTLFLDSLKIKNHNFHVKPEFIDADKKRFLSKKAFLKENYYNTVYLEITNFLILSKPDLIVFNQGVESPDAIILCEIANKNRIKVAVPNALRFFGGSFFSNTYIERINFPIKGELKSYKYNSDNLPYFFNQPVIKRTNSLSRSRIKRVYKLLFDKKNNITFSIIRIRLYNLFFPGDSYYKLVGSRNFNSFVQKNINFNCSYVYYPLQYTPESSINVPSPYYIDQLRAIDEIRYCLPPGFLLYVREHPAMIGRRDSSFYRNVVSKSRVRLITSEISSHEVIQNSKCVISITGTAVIEAFYFKIPSILLGENFFSPFLINKLNNLKNNSLNAPSDVDISKSLKEIGKLSSSFYALAPDYYDILKDDNINVLLEQLKRYYDSV